MILKIWTIWKICRWVRMPQPLRFSIFWGVNCVYPKNRYWHSVLLPTSGFVFLLLRLACSAATFSTLLRALTSVTSDRIIFEQFLGDRICTNDRFFVLEMIFSNIRSFVSKHRASVFHVLRTVEQCLHCLLNLRNSSFIWNCIWNPEGTVQETSHSAYGQHVSFLFRPLFLSKPAVVNKLPEIVSYQFSSYYRMLHEEIFFNVFVLYHYLYRITTFTVYCEWLFDVEHI